MTMHPITGYINRVIHGDCIDVMRTMPAASVDLILTDPPYIVRYVSRDGRRSPATITAVGFCRPLPKRIAS